jgi:hypothetical protein
MEVFFKGAAIFACKEAFLRPYHGNLEQRNHEDGRKEEGYGIQGDGYTDSEDDKAQIHGVASETEHPGRDEGSSGFEGARGRAVAVKLTDASQPDRKGHEADRCAHEGTRNADVGKEANRIKPMAYPARTEAPENQQRCWNHPALSLSPIHAARCLSCLTAGGSAASAAERSELAAAAG